MNPPAAALVEASKRYPNGTLAVDRVSLAARRGELLAIVGENGAGKSTVMKMLFGLESPSAGEVRVAGARVRLRGPGDAIAAGIGLVPQHVQLVPSFTVAENVMLGAEPLRGGLLDHRRALAEVAATARRFDIEIDPGARVEGLSIGERQRVEILKALHRRARVLLLDEPSAVLAPHESARMFGALRRLAAEGFAIVVITHSLPEVLAHSDRYAVLRAGRLSAAGATHATSAATLATHIVGHAPDTRPPAARERATQALLRVRGLALSTPQRPDALADIDFDIGAGEILGIAGVEGNGQSELADVLGGLTAPDSGGATLGGLTCTGRGVRRARAAGVAVVTEDRLHDGVAPRLSVRDNLVAATYHQAPFSRRGLLDRARALAFAREQIDRFDVATASTELAIDALSGGNMQKAVLARELATAPRLLLACQPTRGVDIGAAGILHVHIAALRDAGSAVLLVSADLDELRLRCDRVVVMYRGRIVAHLRAADAAPAALGGWMTGLHGAAAVPARLDSPFSGAPAP